MADNTNSLSISSSDLFNELSQLTEQTKQQVAIQANSAVTILFWQVGNRINQDILQKNVPNTENKLCRHCRLNWKTNTVEILK